MNGNLFSLTSYLVIYLYHGRHKITLNILNGFIYFSIGVDMKRFTTLLATATLTGLMSTVAMAASLNGTQWQSVDDKTGEKKAIIKMTESNGVVTGTIIKINDASKAKEVCSKCSGSLKNRPIVGLPILTGLKADGDNKWSGGDLVDPENGKVYGGKVTLADNGQSLKLTGNIKHTPLKRSQTWTRVK